MGFYTRFTDPAARETIVQYFQFIKRYDKVYRGNRSHAEVLLLFPRSAVHQSDVASVDKFRKIGASLLDDHVLFDVLPDELADDAARARYTAVLSVDSPPLSAAVRSKLSRFTAPAAVRVSASRSANENDLVLHLVNYNREEPPKRNGQPDPGGGIAGEKPIAVERLGVRLVLPGDARAHEIRIATPEQPDSQPVTFEASGREITFDVPRFLVYAIVRIELKGGSETQRR
jgi:hypothetical protein